MLEQLNVFQGPAERVPLVDELRAPQDVLSHPSMSVEAKRATLASWASDRHAVPNFPGVRQLENGSLVSLAEILQALRELDDEPMPDNSSNNLVSLAEFRRQHRMRPLLCGVSTFSSDDDPPPRPAAASFPVSYSKVDAVGGLAAAEQSRCRAL